MSLKTRIAKLTFALVLATPAMAMAIGAIAVDDQEGDEQPGYGLSVGHDSKEAARKAALRECKSAGNENCRVVVSFDGCGAYAASNKFYGTGTGTSIAKAERMALEQCGNKACSVVVSECE